MKVRKGKKCNDIFSLFEEIYFTQYIKYLENQPFGWIAVDAKGYVRYVNHMAGYIRGVQPSSVLGKPVSEVFPDSLINETISTGTQYLEKKQLIQGRAMRCSVIVVKLNNQLMSVTESLRDDEKMESLECELARLKKKDYMRELIINQLFEELIVVDKDCQLAYASGKAARMMGKYDGEIRGLNVSHPDLGSDMKKVMDSGTSRVSEIYEPNGRWMTRYEIPLYEENKLIGAAGYVLPWVARNNLAGLKKTSVRLPKDNLQPDKRGVRYSIHDIVGESHALRDTKEKALRIAEGDSTVLITGESGTGKELFAQAIHMAGHRKEGPFIRVNCAGIPEALIETDLFGYEPGSFTGAQKSGKPGKFELAHGGTLFFDEIGEMSMAMQAKLLSVIQENMMFERVGGTNYYETDVRIVAATNKNLWEMVKTGKFREDLFYRINVVSLEIPPLRNRRNDIPMLIRHFIPMINKVIGCQVKVVDAKVLDTFERYDWPGNVRELRNFLEATMNFVEGERINISNLPPRMIENMLSAPNQKKPEGRAQGSPLKVMEVAEKGFIEEALRLKNGNRRQAAISINMPRSTFYYKLKRYGIRVNGENTISTP